jgi:multidrug efflux pump subunit AcrB
MHKVISHFVKYPVTVNVLIIAIAVLGIIGMFSLKSSFFPLNESRTINISVNYPGASPLEMEEGVVMKIEDNLRGLVGIDRFTSKSSENTASISVEVLKGYNIDVVLADVKNAVDRVPSYPIGMEPPVISKGVFRTVAISVVLSGENIPLRTLKLIARDVETDLRSIDGISQVETSGFPAEEIEIAVKEDRMRAYSLTFSEVSTAVAKANILATGGSIKTETEEYLIRVNNRSYFGRELDRIVVKVTPAGKKLLLSDIAEVRDRWSENPERLYFNGAPSVQIAISTTNNEDLIAAADLTKDYIEEFNASHNNVELNVTSDPSLLVVQRTELLLKNGLQGICLVLLFLAIFLKPRLAFWVAFGLPISFLGMFMFASSFGVTINIMSLFAMIIVIGILVDDGIVIAENIYAHYREGKDPITAALDGTKEVIPAITSAILTTVIAFSTFFFLDGRIGDFFGEVAVIVVLTLSLSLIEALVILPAHVAHSNALKSSQKTYVFNRYADEFIKWIRDVVYAPCLTFFLKNKFLGLAIPIMILIITLGAIAGGLIRISFFPNIASDRIEVTLRMPQGTSEHITDSIISQIEDAAWQVNNNFTKRQTGNQEVIENIIKKIGPGTSNASLTINLLPGESRDFPSFVIASALDEEVGELYGIESVEYGSGSNFGGKPISVSIMGNNIEELKGAKELLKKAYSENPQLKDISDNDPAGIKEIELKLKDNAYAMGFNFNDVISQVRSGFFGNQVQRFQRGRDEIKVWVRYDRVERSSIQNLDQMRIVSPSGQRVPLAEIADYKIERGEISINHLDGKREINVQADLKNPKTSATDIMAEMQEDLLPVIQAQFPSVTASFEGQNREATKVTSSAKKVLPIALFMIYVLIAFTFRTFSQPLMLLLMIPFSLIAVAWGHFIHDLSISIPSFLGIIALLGIVVNDGLVLIGKFNTYLKQGMNFDDALIAAGKSRFRAIFLTSLTTVAGLSPLILEKSRQAQFLIPMAISISYGIMLATLLTLLMLPLLLSIGNKFKVYTTWLKTGKKPTDEEVERAIIEQKVEEETYEIA